MKKLFLTVAFVVVASAGFARGSTNKIGAYVGLPIGLSYTRSMSNLIDFDFVAGFDVVRSGFFAAGEVLNVRLAPLFKVFKTPVDSASGTLSLGPALGIHFGTYWWAYYYNNENPFTGGFSVMLPLRFEFDFNTPFSLFLELVPLGVQVSFFRTYYSDGYGNTQSRIVTPVGYYFSGGVGLRYRF